MRLVRRVQAEKKPPIVGVIVEKIVAIDISGG
jgi:hypothetical protein